MRSCERSSLWICGAAAALLFAACAGPTGAPRGTAVAQFSDRVRGAFRTAQTAWCAQDLTPLRPFVSDGVYERFAIQIDEERALGYRDRMDGLLVSDASIVGASFEGAFDV